MKPDVILFAYSEGIGLTYHLTQFAISLKKINSNLFVVHNGKEQNPGLIEKLKNAEIKTVNINSENALNNIITKDSVIHCQGFSHVKLANKYAKEKGAKIIITLHAYRNSKFYKNLFIRYLLFRFKTIDKWVFSTFYSYLDFKANGFNKDFSIIPLGLEQTSEIKPIAEYQDIFDKRKEVYSPRVKYIFYGAQFYSHKRHRLLLRTLAPLLKHQKNITLILCGSGKLLERIRDLSIKLEIREQVKFLGRVDRNIFLSHLKNASVAVVPSKTETFGHNILEPLLLNTPVVSTPVGIAPEIIKDYENGALCELNNSSKFIKSIFHFCMNRNNKILDNSILVEFSWDNIARRYLNAYISLNENINQHLQS